MLDQPYIRVVKNSSGIAMDGRAKCSFGYKIETPTSADVEGAFAEWNWDGTQLLVRNDRYGYYPIFYYATGSGVCVSTSLLRLLQLGAPTRLDAAAMAVFLRTGGFVGEDTPFEAIRAFPPGATLRWQNGALHLASHGLLINRVVNTSYEEALHRYMSLFRSAIHRHLPPSRNFVVPLSGGRDSRYILLELCEAGFKPDVCVTQLVFPRTTVSTDQNVAVAQRLCKELGIKHVVIEQRSSKVSAELRKNQLTEFCSLDHAWGLPFADYLNEHWDYIYDGIAGDILAAGAFLTPSLLSSVQSAEFGALAAEILGEEGYLPRLLPSAQYKRFGRALAMERLESEICRHAGSANPIGSFYFYNRTRRTVATGSFKMLGQRAHVLMPYLDHDLYDFLTSLPLEHVVDGQFHDRAILTAHPRYAHLPFEDKKKRPVPDRQYLQKATLEHARYVLLGTAGPMIRRSGLLIRLLRCVIDKRFQDQILGFGPIALYLQQIAGLDS